MVHRCCARAARRGRGSALFDGLHGQRAALSGHAVCGAATSASLMEMFARADVNAEVFAYGRDVSRGTLLRLRNADGGGVHHLGEYRWTPDLWPATLGLIPGIPGRSGSACSGRQSAMDTTRFSSVGPAGERGDSRRSPAEPCPNGRGRYWTQLLKDDLAERDGAHQPCSTCAIIFPVADEVGLREMRQNASELVRRAEAGSG